MKKIKLIIIAILGVFVIASCNKEEEVIKSTSNESNEKRFHVNGSATCMPGDTTLDNSNIVVTDENGNPLELEFLDELIAECLNDFWNFYGGLNSKSANNELNIANEELTIRDENGNIIDVNTFASENPELLENVKSMISNTVMTWAEQTIADMENNGENE
ncbi:MAG: hypothetical protein J6V54_01730 [Bacteroidales bacterium]|nr:hypothetical protein [Bacteroidales bacterium]